MTSVSLRAAPDPQAEQSVDRRATGVLATVGALTVAAVLATTSIVQARAMPESFADLAEQVAPAVVDITVVHGASAAPASGQAVPNAPQEGPFKDFFERFFDGEQGQPQVPSQPGPRSGGVGSGFIMDPEGYVVTNNHVVAGASEITVTTKDGTDFDAELIGRDDRTDLALLKIESDATLPYVEFGESDEVRVGDWVMAVGNPFGLGGTVTAGIVSARGRDLRGGTLVDFMQIDAAINRGNSGGPAFNAEGEVIGINTAIFSPSGGNVGIGFAIPSDQAEEIIADLRDDGKIERGWLGVRIQPVTKDIAEGFGMKKAKGALISAVESDSPASAAGLKAGDVILTWDGDEIAKFKDLPRLVAATDPKTEVPVKIWRDKAEAKVEVTTGALPEPDKLAAVQPKAKPEIGQTEIPETGLSVANLDDEMRAKFGLAEDAKGVLVTKVDNNSLAAEMGLRPGDIIKSVALQDVDSADALAEKVKALRTDGEPVAMLMVWRQGAESFMALRLADA
ncbi:MAG: DegQ family serine endoprotease [Pseudomonadota bacterium]